METGKNLHSENKELTKGRMQESDAKKRVTGKKKLRKIIFARPLMDITKSHLSQDQEKNIPVNEIAK